MEPLFLEYPQAQDLYGQDHTFLFGHDLFVAPVVSEKVDAEEFRLPPGDWFDFWTGAKHSSNEQIALHPQLDETPLYVRGGAIVAMQPVVQSTNNTPDGPLELRVYPGSDCRGSLYEDDGISFAYEKGDFLRVNFSCLLSPNAVTVTSAIEKNAFRPWWNSTQLEIYGMTVEPKEVHIGEQPFRDWRYDGQTHVVTLRVPNALRNWNVRVDF